MSLNNFHAAAILASPAITVHGGCVPLFSIFSLYLIFSFVPPLVPPYEPVLSLLNGVLNLSLLFVWGQILVFSKAIRDNLECTNKGYSELELDFFLTF